MTHPRPPAEDAFAGRIVDGLADVINAVADLACPERRFLRRAWFAAACEAYGGRPSTLVVERGGQPAFAMPLVWVGPRTFKLASVPGSYWPLRAPVVAAGSGPGVFATALTLLQPSARALRIGPVPDGDAASTGLIDAARRAGWTVLDRTVAASWLLDLVPADGEWPRGSTLRKNRFHEKHLASHGALEWQLLGAGDWPGALEDIATVERVSWHGQERDRKFAGSQHATFWRLAAADPVLATMFAGALLRIDGRPAAFSFDIVAGETIFAIANSFDPAFAKHSPGKLLQYRNLTAQRARGMRLVDWGAGDSGYKRTMGAVEGPALRDWLLLAPGLPAIAGRWLAGRWGFRPVA